MEAYPAMLQNFTAKLPPQADYNNWSDKKLGEITKGAE